VLIDHLVQAESFEEGLAEVLETYLAAPSTATIASKRLMAQAFNEPFENVYERSLPLLADCLNSPDVDAASQVWHRRRAKRGRQSGFLSVRRRSRW
jgi:hypothetical protein